MTVHQAKQTTPLPSICMYGKVGVSAGLFVIWRYHSYSFVLPSTRDPLLEWLMVPLLVRCFHRSRGTLSTKGPCLSFFNHAHQQLNDLCMTFYRSLLQRTVF